jgi:formiminotetrahydrofolate cyclodeaminase
MSTSTPPEAYQLPAELPSLTQFAQRLAIGPRRASAGATAALVVALAADLVAQVAERSQGWEEHQGALAQVDVVRDRATARARDVAVAYHRLLDTLDEAVADSEPSTDSTELGRQLIGVADLLLEIAETACDCAALAVAVAKDGDTVVRADATAAAVLAAAGAEMAAHLVEVNLLVSTQQETTARAHQLAGTAAEYRSVALGIMR